MARSKTTYKKTTPAVSITETTAYSIKNVYTKGTGGEISFKLNTSSKSLIVELMPQCGEREVDSKSIVSVKLGIDDIGRMLAIFNGSNKNTISVQHNESETIHFTFKRTETENTPYVVVITCSGDGSGIERRNAIYIQPSQAEVLNVLFRSAVSRLLGL